MTKPDDLLQRRHVLPARHGRLRAQVCSAVRQSPAGNLERRVGTQMKDRRRLHSPRQWPECARAKCPPACEYRAGSRRSAIAAASLSAIASSAPRASSTTPPSELRWLPANAALIFFVQTRRAESYRRSWRGWLWCKSPQDWLRQPNRMLLQPFTPRSPASSNRPRE